MHELSGNREAVLEVLEQTIFHLGREGDGGKKDAAAKRIGMKSLGLTSQPQWTKQRDATIDILQRAYEREQDRASLLRIADLRLVPSESVSKDWYMPRDRTLAVFQAAMDEHIDLKLKESAAARKKIENGDSNG